MNMVSGSFRETIRTKKGIGLRRREVIGESVTEEVITHHHANSNCVTGSIISPASSRRRARLPNQVPAPKAMQVNIEVIE